MDQLSLDFNEAEAYAHGTKSASAEAVAHIMVQKFVMYSPLYRLEQEFQRQGLKLSRQTMANWVLNVSDTWLRPIYDVLHRNLCRETVLHRMKRRCRC